MPVRLDPVGLFLHQLDESWTRPCRSRGARRVPGTRSPRRGSGPAGAPGPNWEAVGTGLPWTRSCCFRILHVMSDRPDLLPCSGVDPTSAARTPGGAATELGAPPPRSACSPTTWPRTTGPTYGGGAVAAGSAMSSSTGGRALSSDQALGLGVELRPWPIGLEARALATELGRGGSLGTSGSAPRPRRRPDRRRSSARRTSAGSVARRSHRTRRRGGRAASRRGWRAGRSTGRTGPGRRRRARPPPAGDRRRGARAAETSRRTGGCRPVGPRARPAPGARGGAAPTGADLTVVLGRARRPAGTRWSIPKLADVRDDEATDRRAGNHRGGEVDDLGPGQPFGGPTVVERRGPRERRRLDGVGDPSTHVTDGGVGRQVDGRPRGDPPHPSATHRPAPPSSSAAGC